MFKPPGDNSQAARMPRIKRVWPRPCLSQTASSRGALPSLWEQWPSTEVGFRPGGGQVFGTSGFSLWNPATPWPGVGLLPVSMPLELPWTSAFPWACQLLLTLLQGLNRFLLPLTDARQGPGKSLLWSKPMEQALYAAKSALAAAAELEHPQADLPHQPHGRHIQHSYQCCPSTFSSSIMGSPFLPRSCCPLRLATAPSTGVAGRLRRDLPLPPHVGG